MNSKEFMQWFEQQIKTRWQGLRPSWIELGDWHWRLQEFDTDTLTQAARQHKATEDYRTPSLKKVYDYACKITAARKPPASRSGEEKKSSGVPEAHHPLSHHNDQPELVERMSRINRYHTELSTSQDQPHRRQRLRLRGVVCADPDLAVSQGLHRRDLPPQR